MIPPWPSPYGGPSNELPYHLRPTDSLRADEPWIGALYLDGPDPTVVPVPAVAPPPGPSRPGGPPVAAGATMESHQEGRSGLGVRTAAAAVSGERPQLEERGPVPPTSQVRGGGRSSRSDRLPPVGRPGGHHGDRDDTGLPADRTFWPAPAVLSAPGAEPSGSGIGHVPPHRAGVLSPGPLGSSTAAGVRGRHRAERPGAAGAVAVPGRAVLRWLEVWVPRLFGLAVLFAASFVVGVLAAVIFAAYGRR